MYFFVEFFFLDSQLNFSSLLENHDQINKKIKWFELFFVVWGTTMTVFTHFWTFCKIQQNGYLLSIDLHSTCNDQIDKISGNLESFEIFWNMMESYESL